MTVAEPKTRRWGILRIALMLGILVTLIVPSTRELHYLNLKLLFRDRGDQTFVQGQPGGCVVTFVPNVQLTKSYQQQCLVNAASSPDAFFLAQIMTWQHLNWPAPATWVDHPLLVWGATELTSQYLRVQQQLALATQPADQEGVASIPELEHLLAVLRLAQQTHADNGALWLAEAALHFHEDDDDAGLRSLATAADNPLWNNLGNVTFTQMRKALQTQGLPRFDATIEAYNFARRYEYEFSLATMRQIYDHLACILTQAVRTGDYEQVKSLLLLWRDLQHGGRQDAQVLNLFRKVPVRPDEPELMEAIARQLHQALPEWDPSSLASKDVTWEVWQAEREAWTHAADELFDNYVRKVVGDSLATALRTEHEAMLAEREGFRDRRVAEDQAILMPMIISSVAGSIALLLLAWTLGALILEVPFSVTGRSQNPSRRPPRLWLFRLLALASCTAMAGLLFSAVDAILQSVGLIRSDYQPLLKPWQEHAISALSLAIVWFIIRLCLEKLSRFRGLAWMSLCVLYLAAVIVTVHYRAEAISAAETVCSFQMATE